MVSVHRVSVAGDVSVIEAAVPRVSAIASVIADAAGCGEALHVIVVVSVAGVAVGDESGIGTAAHRARMVGGVLGVAVGVLVHRVSVIGVVEAVKVTTVE